MASGTQGVLRKLHGIIPLVSTTTSRLQTTSPHHNLPPPISQNKRTLGTRALCCGCRGIPPHARWSALLQQAASKPLSLAPTLTTLRHAAEQVTRAQSLSCNLRKRMHLGDEGAQLRLQGRQVAFACQGRTYCRDGVQYHARVVPRVRQLDQHEQWTDACGRSGCKDREGLKMKKVLECNRP